METDDKTSLCATFVPQTNNGTRQPLNQGLVKRRSCIFALAALACSTPPEGHARWTLRLLEDKVIGLA